MRSTYDELIHAKYFPPSSDRPVPEKYELIGDVILKAHPEGAGPLLDIGPETTRIVDFLAKRLALRPEEYHIVDISNTVVNQLRSDGWSALNVDVSEEALPYSDQSFKVAVMSEVLEHLVDPDHALSEVRRVLKPNGTLILTTPNLASWFNRGLLLLGIQPIFTETGTSWVFGRGRLLPRARPVGHLRVLTRRAVIELLEYQGFMIDTLAGLAMDVGSTRLRTIRWIDRRFSMMPEFAAGLFVVGRPDERQSTEARNR